ncbi:MAG: quinone oxidoreductase [Porticoccaceae bacterium]
MSKAIVIDRYGGPEVMAIRELDCAAPGAGEVLVRQHAIGVNFIDVYHRTGLYPYPLPLTPGSEGAGEVVAIGDDVSDVRIGDRVAYSVALGGYSEQRIVPASQLVPLPDFIDYDTAAAVMLKGLTAYYLLHDTWPVGPGETLLFHAAAGGMGLIACQWAASLGARVIGTAGGPEKVALALQNGCEAAIDYRADDFVARVRELTDGEGVDVVYDGVGQAIFEQSLDCLRPRGLMVSYGNATGPVAVPDLGILARKGSLFLTRPTGAHYFATRQATLRAADALFNAIARGAIKPYIGQRFPLADAAAAHRALEGRATLGSTLLIP